MPRPLLLAAAMIMPLSACSQEDAAPEADPAGQPQIATSLDDYAMPVDRSDQVTAIDAATGDATGMPRDGGAVVAPPKPASRAADETAEPVVTAPAVALPAPPPAMTPPSPPTPALPTATGG